MAKIIQRRVVVVLVRLRWPLTFVGATFFRHGATLMRDEAFLIVILPNSGIGT